MKAVWKKALSCLITLTMAISFVPTVAFAAVTPNVPIYVLHKDISTNKVLPYKIGTGKNSKLTPAGSTTAAISGWTSNSETINLWVYSTDMTTEGKNDGTTIPYVIDNNGGSTKYYLTRIDVTSSSDENDQPQTIMTKEQIVSAATEGNKEIAYNFNPSTDISAEATQGTQQKYFIQYYWSTTDPTGSEQPPVEKNTYTIEYNVNRPAESTIFPVGTEGNMVIGEDGISDSELTTVEQVGDLQLSVKQDSNFTVGKAKYKDFFAYKKLENGYSYWVFSGWNDEKDTSHDQGKSITATSDLAGEDNVITLTGTWSEVTALPTGVDSDELKKALEASTAPVIVNNNVSSGDIIVQKTNTDTNTSTLDNRYKKGTVLETDETNTIFYQVTGKLNERIINILGQNYSNDFIDKLDITVTPDPKLTMASTAENVTFTIDCPYLYPTGLKAGETVVTATIVDNSGNNLPSTSPTTNGSPYKINVALNDIKDTDGHIKPLTFSLDWRAGNYDYNEVGNESKLTISGFEMKLLGQVADTEKANFELITTGKSESEIDMSKMGGHIDRFRYQNVQAILDNSPKLQTLLCGNSSNPTAYAYALIAVEDYLNGDTPTVVPFNEAKAEYDHLEISPVELTKYVTGNETHDENDFANCFPEPRYNGISDNATIKAIGVDGLKTEDQVFDIVYSHREEDGSKGNVLYDGEDHEPGTYIASIETKSGSGTTLANILINGKPIRCEDSLLHVLAVSKADGLDNIQEIASKVTTVIPNSTELNREKAMAVMPKDQTYLVNNIEGEPVDMTDANIRLLHDELLSSESGEDHYLNLLVKRLNLPGEKRQYAMKYLDLIDANDSNVLVTAQSPYEIYIPYPSGTNMSTDFRLFRFNDLTRTYADDVDYGPGVEAAINGTSVTEMTSLKKTTAGLRFEIQPSEKEELIANEATIGAMALTWTENSGDGGETTRYIIEATATDGGTITPDGKVPVIRGSSKTFTITPEEGYKIQDVLVDGQSVGAVESYTFKNVRAKHTIQAVFAPVHQVVDPDESGVSDWLNTKDHDAYLHGYPSGLFGPDRDMTRAEVAQMFYNLLLDQNVAVTVQFADVPADAWYAKPVNTLASLGILKGVGEDRFEPQRSITRAEFTTIAMRFGDLKEGGENIFSDVEPEDWFYNQVVGSIQYGWIGGYEDGTFRPDNTITRAEVTAITNRMLGRAADEAYVTAHKTDLRQFPDLTEIHWGYYHVMEATNAHDYTKENGTEDWKGLKT